MDWHPMCVHYVWWHNVDNIVRVGYVQLQSAWLIAGKVFHIIGRMTVLFVIYYVASHHMNGNRNKWWHKSPHNNPMKYIKKTIAFMIIFRQQINTIAIISYHCFYSLFILYYCAWKCVVYQWLYGNRYRSWNVIIIIRWWDTYTCWNGDNALVWLFRLTNVCANKCMAYDE